MAGIVTHPIDMVKTAVQADMGKERFFNSLSCSINYREDLWNWRSFKGFAFRTVRLCVAFIVIANIREQWIVFSTLKYIS